MSVMESVTGPQSIASNPHLRINGIHLFSGMKEPVRPGICSCCSQSAMIAGCKEIPTFFGPITIPLCDPCISHYHTMMIDPWLFKGQPRKIDAKKVRQYVKPYIWESDVD